MTIYGALVILLRDDTIPFWIHIGRFLSTRDLNLPFVTGSFYHDIDKYLISYLNSNS